MDVASLLSRIQSDPRYAGQIQHIQRVEGRPPSYATLDPPLAEPLSQLLRSQGIDQLYSHQVRAVQAARAGRDWVVVTGTASGKTLCYHIPVLETGWQDPSARALYLYPTKALSQDQLRGLEALLGKECERFRPRVYDGDTPVSVRRRARAESRIILTNPDMLHVSILPYHPQWAVFLSELRYVIIDEIHMYRGIFGAHVANVLRRLQRVCAHYGSRPLFLAASATVANPGELASSLVNRKVEVISEDGSPRGSKWFVFWDPRAPEGSYRTATDDAVWWLEELIAQGAQALAFTRTRQAAELIHRYLRERLEERGSPAASRVRAYRGGYLPSERRSIEQGLFSGRLQAVACTNALELGIDVGSLDAALLVHYPGSIAATWQQAGRAGRRQGESLAVLLAGADPIDQYLMRHPDFLFSQSPEHAVVDPHNPYVLAMHLPAAAHELPLDPDEVANEFGPAAVELLEILAESRQLVETAGRFYATGGQHPAQRISLRHMSQDTFSIVWRSGGAAHPDQCQVIANVDAISAPELIYPEAVYLHDGQSYIVKKLDWNARIAYVDKQETDYYTQAILESTVHIQQQLQRHASWPSDVLGFGTAQVMWKTVAFKKIQFVTRENIGYGSVDLPEQSLETTAFWLIPDASTCKALKSERLRPSEALCGIRNLAITAIPVIAMCDRQDISGVVDSKNFGQSALIMYDRYPGGLGYCEKAFYCIDALLELCYQLVTECPCSEGCPGCVGLPNLRPAMHSDPDLSRGYPIPDKQAAKRLLEYLLRVTAGAEGCCDAAVG
ncbi:MAG: putative ATP-dependent helicase YprA [Pirellulaceae bacterium]|nr:MAG: putative ATP-dependent helicase YprA [Pirellulaceae bacterium]